MPELIIEWHYGKNISLKDRPDVNHNRQWLFTMLLKDQVGGGRAETFRS